MGAPTEEQNWDTGDHESMVMGGDTQSVKFLVFISSSFADHSVPPVPTFIGSQRTSAHAPKMCSWNMDPLLDSASTLSKDHVNSGNIIPAVQGNFTSLTAKLCSQLF